VQKKSLSWVKKIRRNGAGVPRGLPRGRGAANSRRWTISKFHTIRAPSPCVSVGAGGEAWRVLPDCFEVALRERERKTIMKTHIYFGFLHFKVAEQARFLKIDFVKDWSMVNGQSLTELFS
jgi:hypothetical protein